MTYDSLYWNSGASFVSLDFLSSSDIISVTIFTDLVTSEALQSRVLSLAPPARAGVAGVLWTGR